MKRKQRIKNSQGERQRERERERDGKEVETHAERERERDRVGKAFLLLIFEFSALLLRGLDWYHYLHVPSPASKTGFPDITSTCLNPKIPIDRKMPIPNQY